MQATPASADFPTLIVDNPAALQAALPALSSPGAWALDTEFMRVDTYYPRLCLVQIATADQVICIDPLAVPDLSPLAPALADPGRPKLMHAARQDLEALEAHGGLRLEGIIDTQIAAALLGLPEQVGYAWLVEHYEGVVLDKSQTRTDWSVRPLSPAQWHYAAQDVVHLPRLWRQMSAALEAAGKRQWLDEECARLALDDTPTTAQRVKGIAQCEGQALAVVKACAEQHAIVPTLLATRRELERLVLGLPTPRLREGWRAGLLARVIPASANGEATS